MAIAERQNFNSAEVFASEIHVLTPFNSYFSACYIRNFVKPKRDLVRQNEWDSLYKECGTLAEPGTSCQKEDTDRRVTRSRTSKELRVDLNTDYIGFTGTAREKNVMERCREYLMISSVEQNPEEELGGGEVSKELKLIFKAYNC